MVCGTSTSNFCHGPLMICLRLTSSHAAGEYIAVVGGSADDGNAGAADDDDVTADDDVAAVVICKLHITSLSWEIMMLQEITQYCMRCTLAEENYSD